MSKLWSYSLLNLVIVLENCCCLGWDSCLGDFTFGSLEATDLSLRGLPLLLFVVLCGGGSEQLLISSGYSSTAGQPSSQSMTLI